MPRDWYHQDLTERVIWHANFAEQLPKLAAKYNISAAVLAEVAADNAWIQFWMPVRLQLNNLRKTLTSYIGIVAGNKNTMRPPSAMNIQLFGTPPPEVEPGIEFRTRKIARTIKGSMVYSFTDGALLGIITPAATARDLSAIEPAFTVRSTGSFKLEIKFNRRRMDAVKFEFRRKGSAWEFAGFLLTSPGIIAIPPSLAGTAEQIELRGFYMLKNLVVGQASDTISAFIAP